jgi:DUF971 family protein
MTASTPTPIEVGRANAHDVKIRWDNGRETVYPARFLRMSCPCAGCIEEMTGRKMLSEDSVPVDVHPLGIFPVGRYAIQIQWSDGHQTGIFTWERLYQMAEQLPGS